MRYRDEPVKLQEAGLFVGRAFLIGFDRVRRKMIRSGQST